MNDPKRFLIPLRVSAEEEDRVRKWIRRRDLVMDQIQGYFMAGSRLQRGLTL
ncbi:MAG: hypothetical protein HY315_07950 [Acidobacteria bacterium]|nr:hypothetical protein [Acidobacteriota bacterium]